MLVQTLINDVHQVSKNNGFWQNRTFEQAVSLIHSEVDEAYDEYEDWINESVIYEPLGVIRHNINKSLNGKYKPEGFVTEIADYVIRILDVFGGMEVDFDKLFRQRLPAYKNGPVIISNIEILSQISFRKSPDIEALLLRLHGHASKALELNRKGESPEVFMMPLLEGAFRSFTYDYTPSKLMDVILEKHHYNILRPFKHGKNY